MTVLLQTRVRRELAARFKSTAQAEGKSTYQVLRDLVEQYTNQSGKQAFASNDYPEHFTLPTSARLKETLRARFRR